MTKTRLAGPRPSAARDAGRAPGSRAARAGRPRPAAPEAPTATGGSPPSARARADASRPGPVVLDGEVAVDDRRDARRRPAARPRRSASPAITVVKRTGHRRRPSGPRRRLHAGRAAAVRRRAGDGRARAVGRRPTSWPRRRAVRRRPPATTMHVGGTAAAHADGRLVHQPRVAEHDVARDSLVAVPRRVRDDAGRRWRAAWAAASRTASS